MTTVNDVSPMTTSEKAFLSSKKKKDKKKDKKHDKKKRDKKVKKRSRSDDIPVQAWTDDTAAAAAALSPPVVSKKPRRENAVRPLVESSALPEGAEPDLTKHALTLLLFYQYVEPPWNEAVYKHVLEHAEHIGKRAGVAGRMRIAREGLNCTLTGSDDAVKAFCTALRQWKPDCFHQTEFKLTHRLPKSQGFTGLKIMPVTELVHYGLEGDKAPPIQHYSGVHLEPADYHRKLAEQDTVVIDVRNHYEAAIGRFDPPGNAKKFLDPKMRKSTEFPVWLDSEGTREKLKGKQVLMYCTGGIRCERASALLKYKMETDPAIKELGIQGVYQLQGGIDKYFKEFPDGGYWKGKNYTFDKRFAHAPVEKETERKDEDNDSKSAALPLGKCEACAKPWDKYCGKRRCPTCGVPSLICKDCFQADQDGTKRLDKRVRCELCVEQNVRSKTDLRVKEEIALEEYEKRQREQGLLNPTQIVSVNPNPDGVTRLYLKNMCRTNMTEEILLKLFPGITHIVWRTDGKTGNFFGQGWVEMESPEAAAASVARSGEKVLGRPLFIEYQPSDGKDVWPPPRSAVTRS